MSRFAQNLKALRLERGLTQAALARRAGLASTAISMYELGQRQPDLDRLERLAQALDAPASALLACAPAVSAEDGFASDFPPSAAPNPNAPAMAAVPSGSPGQREQGSHPLAQEEAALLRDYRALDEQARRDLRQYLRQAVRSPSP